MMIIDSIVLFSWKIKICLIYFSSTKILELYGLIFRNLWLIYLFIFVPILLKFWDFNAVFHLFESKNFSAISFPLLILDVSMIPFGMTCDPEMSMEEMMGMRGDGMGMRGDGMPGDGTGMRGDGMGMRGDGMGMPGKEMEDGVMEHHRVPCLKW